MSRPTASFNGTDFASAVPGLIITGVVPQRFPNRALTVVQIANRDKSVLSIANYSDKKINVLVEIGQNTRELLDDAIDVLYKFLQPQEAALVVSVGSGTRQWTATLANVSISDVLGGHALLDIEFQCSDPIGRDVNTTQLFTTALTGSTSNTNFVVGGTAYWQQPKITITYSALTGGSSAQIRVGNDATGQQIIITRTMVAGDVLEIDSMLGTVKVNGVEVAYTGAFPQWNPGSGTLSYEDSMTTRTFTMTGVYYKRYV